MSKTIVRLITIAMPIRLANSALQLTVLTNDDSNIEPALLGAAASVEDMINGDIELEDEDDGRRSKS